MANNRKKDKKDKIDLIVEDDDSWVNSSSSKKLSPINDILFKLPVVKYPFIGTPKEVQEELDKIVLEMQEDLMCKKSCEDFNRIHLYMHGYLLNVVLKQFPYIKGYETVDIYQESLIAVRFKAIPNFNCDKGMSFLNFSKMCIRRHLITILNASKNRLKDQAMNQAISLDGKVDENDSNSTTMSNLVSDSSNVDEMIDRKEAYSVTLVTLKEYLSDFERDVLDFWLETNSYKEIAKELSKRHNKRVLPKAIDNALLRIRKKAEYIRLISKDDDLPMFIQ